MKTLLAWLSLPKTLPSFKQGHACKTGSQLRDYTLMVIGLKAIWPNNSCASQLLDRVHLQRFSGQMKPGLLPGHIFR